MQSKLTLTVEEKVIRKAKVFAKKRKVSLSELVENFFRSLTTSVSDPESDFTPTVKSLYGSLPSSGDDDYKIRSARKESGDMDNVFIDTDIILDLLTGREPFGIHAAALFSLAEKRQIRISVTALSFVNSYYVLVKASGHKAVIEKLKKLAELVDIVGTPKQVVVEALTSIFSDFEDAIQNFSASFAKNSILLTRNLKDYKTSNLVVLSPEIYLKQRVI